MLARRFSILEVSGDSGLALELDSLELQDCSGEDETRCRGLVDEPEEE